MELLIEIYLYNFIITTHA